MSHLRVGRHLVVVIDVIGPHPSTGTGPAMKAIAYTLSFARKAFGRPAIHSMISSFNRSAHHC
jgi:hypothetical protein